MKPPGVRAAYVLEITRGGQEDSAAGLGGALIEHDL